MVEYVHVPVMLGECMQGLNVKSGGVYFDGTLGGAGHSSEILRLSSPNGFLLATDLDDYALKRADAKLSEFCGRYKLVKDNFKNFLEIKEKVGIEKFDGILLDLGVSSFQLDDKSRGFSYMADGETLDMRMDKNSPFSALDVVNGYDEVKLKKIISEYGEEKFASAIAKSIVKERKIEQITTVSRLNEIILQSIPKKFQKGGHPSKKTFQAIRIEVNGELEGLYETVINMARSLKVGGRLAIMTFHSLEDRIVKRAFKELETDCICPKSLPICVCGKKKEIEILTKRPVTAGEEELGKNPRAASAKLRVAQKV